eukprot:1149775-Pelagomonas_calceolata.AAC.9
MCALAPSSAEVVGSLFGPFVIVPQRQVPRMIVVQSMAASFPNNCSEESCPHIGSHQARSRRAPHRET